jgi:hypothetical protein
MPLPDWSPPPQRQPVESKWETVLEYFASGAPGHRFASGLESSVTWDTAHISSTKGPWWPWKPGVQYYADNCCKTLGSSRVVEGPVTSPDPWCLWPQVWRLLLVWPSFRDFPGCTHLRLCCSLRYSKFLKELHSVNKMALEEAWHSQASAWIFLISGGKCM